MSEWLLFNANSAFFSAISWREQINFSWDDAEVLFVPDQHAELDFYSAGSLKQKSAGRYVAPLGQISLIPSQPVFALFPECCVLSEEAAHTNCIVFGLTGPWLELNMKRWPRPVKYFWNIEDNGMNFIWQVFSVILWLYVAFLSC